MILFIILKYLASVVSLIFLPKTLIWINQISDIKFIESCRAGGKWGNEKYLQKITDIPFSIRFITTFCKDFKSL